MLTSMCEVCYLGGRWKFNEVALQAVGILKMWMSFSMVMNVVPFPGHIRVIMFAGAESGVVRIHTFGAICDGMFTSDVFLTCSEHHEEMPAWFLTNKAEVHVG